MLTQEGHRCLSALAEPNISIFETKICYAISTCPAPAKQQLRLVSGLQLADGWGYRYLVSGREGTVYGGVACTGWKWIQTSKHSCSKTRFLGALLQHWMFCKGSHSRCGEGWPQGTARHSPTPCRLSLLLDQVSEHARYPSFSILL